MAVFATEEEQTKQYNRLRRDVGTNEAILTDPLAEEYFEEAQEKYPTDTAKMIAYARVIALRGIRASAAMLGKYARNQSQDDLTKVFDNLGKLLEEWVGNTEEAADPADDTEAAPVLFFSRMPGYRGR